MATGYDYNEGVTVTLTKDCYPSNTLKFKQGDIIVYNLFGRRSWNVVTEDSKSETNHSVTISVHRLNVSKFSLIRYFQLKIFKHVYNGN